MLGSIGCSSEDAAEAPDVAKDAGQEAAPEAGVDAADAASDADPVVDGETPGDAAQDAPQDAPQALQCERVALDPPVYVTDFSATSEDTVIATGRQGTSSVLMTFDGQTPTIVATVAEEPTAGPPAGSNHTSLVTVSARSATEVYAGGQITHVIDGGGVPAIDQYQAVIMRSTGSDAQVDWTSEAVSPGALAPAVRSIWAAAGGPIMAAVSVSLNGDCPVETKFIERGSAGWNEVQTVPDFFVSDLWGSGDTLVAVGYKCAPGQTAAIYAYQQGSWTEQSLTIESIPSTSPTRLLSVWGKGTDEIRAVGGSATYKATPLLLRWSGTAWEEQSEPTADPVMGKNALEGVWFTDASRLYLAPPLASLEGNELSSMCNLEYLTALSGTTSWGVVAAEYDTDPTEEASLVVLR